jgi:hypothetical protein
MIVAIAEQISQSLSIFASIGYQDLSALYRLSFHEQRYEKQKQPVRAVLQIGMIDVPVRKVNKQNEVTQASQ